MLDILFIGEIQPKYSEVIVSISKANLCIDDYCENVLIGKNTPIGTFQLQQKQTDSPGYKGDVLVFKEEKYKTYAVHRVWNEIPSQKRYTRLASSNVNDRVVSAGCINVSDSLYEKLLFQTSIRIEN